MKGIKTRAMVFVGLFVVMLVVLVLQVLEVRKYNEFVEGEKRMVDQCIWSASLLPASSTEVSLQVCIGLTDNKEALAIIAREVKDSYRLDKEAKERLAIRMQRRVFQLDVIGK